MFAKRLKNSALSRESLLCIPLGPKVDYILLDLTTYNGSATVSVSYSAKEPTTSVVKPSTAEETDVAEKKTVAYKEKATKNMAYKKYYGLSYTTLSRKSIKSAPSKAFSMTILFLILDLDPYVRGHAIESAQDDAVIA